MLESKSQNDLRPALTFGEKAVGLSFNPGGNPKVERIKRLSADLIDEINSSREDEHGRLGSEQQAMLTLAIRRIQEGQMWGVKAVTWQY